MEPGILDFPNLLAHLLAAGATPTLDGHYVMQIISRVLHITFAMIMVGGLFYLRSVLAPAGPKACFAGRREVWARWVGIATFFLLASGIYNAMIILGKGQGPDTRLPPTYHMLLGIKFLLALLVMVVMSLLAGKTAAAERFRGNMKRWLNIAWMAALAIVILAAVMRSFH
jgi:uncharacterized membrane protein